MDDDKLWDLVGRIQQGSGESLAPLLENIIPRLQGYLRAKFPGHERKVEDVVQLACISITKTLPRLVRRGSFISYCVTIAFGLMANEIKKASSRHEPTPMEEIERQLEADPERGKNAEAEWRIDQTKKALDLADDECRRLLLMHFYDHQTYKQMAKAEGCSTGAIAKRVQRCLERFEPILQQLLNE